MPEQAEFAFRGVCPPGECNDESALVSSYMSYGMGPLDLIPLAQ